MTVATGGTPTRFAATAATARGRRPAPSRTELITAAQRLLMSRYGMDGAQAFSLLVALSKQRGDSLAAAARQVMLDEPGPGHHTSPSRQSQVSSAVVSSSMPTGSTNSERSSSGVRTTPLGDSAEVTPSQGSQPRTG